MVDVVLCAPLRRRRDRLRGLALGADEKNATAASRDIAQREQRLMQQRDGLGQIDDVDVVAGAIDERRHFGIPALGAMAEMGARLQQLAHGEFWQSHTRTSPSPVSLTRGYAPCFGRFRRWRPLPGTGRAGATRSFKPTLRVRNGGGYRDAA